MTQVLPRPVAGLRFQESHVDGISSEASEGFWALWRHDADALRAVDIRPVKKNPDSKSAYWIVTWSPGKVAPEAVDRVLEDLQLALFASQRQTAEHEAEVARRNRLIQREQDFDRERRIEIARRKLADRFGDQADTELVAAAQAEGRASWQQWHSFCVNKKRLAEFSAVNARISIPQAVWLTELVDQTTAKAEHVRDNLKSADDTVDWPDDDVAAAVESLCWHDSDQATEENGAGWSKADSSKGHWCHGMIKRGGSDKMIGIDAARSIVGKYTEQLAKGVA